MVTPHHIEPQPTNCGDGGFCVVGRSPAPYMGGPVPRPPRRGAGPPWLFGGLHVAKAVDKRGTRGSVTGRQPAPCMGGPVPRPPRRGVGPPGTFDVTLRGIQLYDCCMEHAPGVRR